MQLPAFVKSRYFVVAVLFTIPVLGSFVYRKIKKRTIFSEVIYQFYKGKSSSITPDMVYRPPRPKEKFSAADFIHFRLEYINAVKSALPRYRKKLAYFIYIRFNTNETFIKNFIVEPKNRAEVTSFLQNNPVWEEKLKMAEAEAQKKKISIPFKSLKTLWQQKEKK